MAPSDLLKALAAATYNERVIDQPLCVLCRRRPVDDAWRPFCSERCKLQDLARWLDGMYRVSGERVSSSDAVPEPDTDSDDPT